jgi:hypothetical protein
MIKEKIKYIDGVFLNNAISNSFYRLTFYMQMKKMAAGLGYSCIANYKKNQSLLAGLCDKYGSDKGAIKVDGHPYSWPAHTYADYYSNLFSHCRTSIGKVFECGLGTNNPSLISSMGSMGKPGASLRVWRDYFPNATIYGADIDVEILFEDDRIHTSYINQIDPCSIDKFWKDLGQKDFDLILDDGLHTFEGGSCLFVNSIKYLKDGGIYIIEDVSVPDLHLFKKFFDGLNYHVEYVSLIRPHLRLGDNNLVVIRK